MGEELWEAAAKEAVAAAAASVGEAGSAAVAGMATGAAAAAASAEADADLAVGRALEAGWARVEGAAEEVAWEVAARGRVVAVRVAAAMETAVAEPESVAVATTDAAAARATAGCPAAREGPPQIRQDEQSAGCYGPPQPRTLSPSTQDRVASHHPASIEQSEMGTALL